MVEQVENGREYQFTFTSNDLDQTEQAETHLKGMSV